MSQLLRGILGCLELVPLTEAFNLCLVQGAPGGRGAAGAGTAIARLMAVRAGADCPTAKDLAIEVAVGH